MYKHILYLIILSLIVIFTVPYCREGIMILLKSHVVIINYLSMVFAGGEVGRVIKSLIAILLIPVAVGSVLAGIYWVFKRSTMPYLAHVIWIIWLVLIIAIISTQS